MNSGVTFLASVTSVNGLGKLVDTDYSEKFDSQEAALNGIINFLSKKATQ